MRYTFSYISVTLLLQIEKNVTADLHRLRRCKIAPVIAAVVADGKKSVTAVQVTERERFCNFGGAKIYNVTKIRLFQLFRKKNIF